MVSKVSSFNAMLLRHKAMPWHMCFDHNLDHVRNTEVAKERLQDNFAYPILTSNI